MIPGFVSGFYSLKECHIDLCRLSKYANARIILSSASGIDLKKRQVLLDGSRPPLDYDVLSLNVGITPSASGIEGADSFATPVKPISSFAEKFHAIIEKCATVSKDGPFRIAVVGGGAGGVELACALQYRLTSMEVPCDVHLVSRSEIMNGLTPHSRKLMLRLMQERDVRVHECKGGVEKVVPGRLLLASGDELEFDECLWCTQAGAPEWFKQTGLPLNDSGFIRVNEFLQSDGGPPNVFAVGDCATSSADPRPKAGVYAVRAVGEIDITF